MTANVILYDEESDHPDNPSFKVTLFTLTTFMLQTTRLCDAGAARRFHELPSSCALASSSLFAAQIVGFV
jgi:hypothetical protein